MCLQASQKCFEVPIYSVVDSSKKKNRKKNGSTPVAAVRHFHFLNGVLFLMYYNDPCIRICTCIIIHILYYSNPHVNVHDSYLGSHYIVRVLYSVWCLVSLVVSLACTVPFRYKV